MLRGRCKLASMKYEYRKAYFLGCSNIKSWNSKDDWIISFNIYIRETKYLNGIPWIYFNNVFQIKIQLSFKVHPNTFSCITVSCVLFRLKGLCENISKKCNDEGCYKVNQRLVIIISNLLNSPTQLVNNFHLLEF